MPDGHSNDRLIESVTARIKLVERCLHELSERARRLPA
jgi:hypothetical protein